MIFGRKNVLILHDKLSVKHFSGFFFFGGGARLLRLCSEPTIERTAMARVGEELIYRVFVTLKTAVTSAHYNL